MKFSTVVLAGIAAQHAVAFPSYLSEALIQIRSADQKGQNEHARLEKRELDGDVAKRDATAGAGCPFAKEKRQAPGVTPPFDASQQYVSNTGAHAFVAPGPSDQRGPCEYPSPFLST